MIGSFYIITHTRAHTHPRTHTHARTHTHVISVICPCCGILYYSTVNSLIRRDLCFSGWVCSAAKFWCSLCVVAGIPVVVPRVRWADGMDDGKEREKPEHPRAKANVFSALTFWYDYFILFVNVRNAICFCYFSQCLKYLVHSYSSDARNVCWDDRDLKEGILMH
jgi:hypothetical protein